MYGVLKVLEERGQVRRGYFVAGLGAAQFALPGAVDRLRSGPRRRRERRPVGHEPPLVLAATDPAQPYGAALALARVATGRPARAAGALVVLAAGGCWSGSTGAATTWSRSRPRRSDDAAGPTRWPRW